VVEEGRQARLSPVVEEGRQARLSPVVEEGRQAPLETTTPHVTSPGFETALARLLNQRRSPPRR